MLPTTSDVSQRVPCRKHFILSVCDLKRETRVTFFFFLLWVSFVLWVKTSVTKHTMYEFLPGWDGDKKSTGDEQSYLGACLSWWGSICHWIWNEILASWTKVFFGSYLPFVVAFCLWKVFTAPRKTACGSSLKKKKEKKKKGKRIVPDIKCFK